MPLRLLAPPAALPARAAETAAGARDVLAQLAGVGYFRVDAERNLVEISPEVERITGFDAAEMLGKPCLTLLRCRECLKGCGVFRFGRVTGARVVLYRKDGSEVEVERGGVAFRDEGGQIVGALETVRPLPPAEAQAAGPPPELETLLTSLGRGYLVADGELRVLSASRSVAALVGAEPEALRGQPLERLLGEELFGVGAPLREAIARGERREGWRGALRTAAGAEVAVSLSVGSVDAHAHCGQAGVRAVVMLRPEPASEAEEEVPAFRGIVAQSAPMQRIFRLIELLRETDATVLVTGESGTGKELVARALHATSHRAEGPFIAVNCAAIPSELLESELFGHVRGAFTGAVRDRPGRFELADHGTLFLDEIGDLAPALQAKLLRVLQEHSFERVGDGRTRRTDVRVIAATHVNLARAVAEGRFREDLYYRLRVVPIDLPPLRQRREDLPPLIRFLLRRIGNRRGRALRLSPEATRALLTYPWPGNVRELENAIEYATAVCAGQTIHLSHLPAEIATGVGEPAEGGFLPVEALPGLYLAPLAPAGVAAPAAPAPALPGLSGEEAAEARRIRAALEQARYRRDAAARLLGMSRTTLWRKMKEYRL